mmetsp:Transcript_35410/g.51876  ORF Transcript_35410/g.51876 Transcript_35410/m.51876 type:complete len:1076 (-) Transcript_35410:385-3612(-)
MPAKVVVDYSEKYGDEGFIDGLWGTVADQLDETSYDDRLDADDDLEKGCIKFPQNKLYGRESNLGLLRGLYSDIIQERKSKGSSASASSRIVFVGGYSGVGKSAVVADLVRQLKEDYNHGGKVVVCAWGKYSKLQSAAAPFSAISDALEQLVVVLTKDEYIDILKNLRKKLCDDDVRMAMTGTFPSVAPLFGPAESDPATKIATSMSQIREAFKEFMCCVCTCLQLPLIWSLDDLQWSDEASLELLKDVLSNKEPNNMLFIGAYRSNEINENHSFHQLMNEVEKVRGKDAARDNMPVSRMDLFGLCLDDIGEFLSDTLGKDSPSEVATLTEVIFKKTLGNIFFVKQALEELVRKNAVFYDTIMFSWEYNVSTVQLDNYIYDDVIDVIKSKITGLPTEVRMLVVIMSFIPNNANMSLMKTLLEGEGVRTTKVEKLISVAINNGIILHLSEVDRYAFAHDKIREASYDIIPKGKQRDELLVRISNVLIDLANADKANTEWALFVAADHLNSVVPELVPRMELARLNFRVAKINLAKGATLGANVNLNDCLTCLNHSGEKWKDYDFTLNLFNELIASEFTVGKFELAYVHLQDVLENANSLDDKFTAYSYKIKTFAEGENRDYNKGVVVGLQICKMYGTTLPNSPKRTDLIKASVKLETELRNRPLTVLSKLPRTEVSTVFGLLKDVQHYAVLEGNNDLAALITKKAIRLSLQKNFLSKDMVPILASHVNVLVKGLAKDISKAKLAYAYANAAEKTSEVFREDKGLYYQVQMELHGGIYPLLRPHRESMEPTIDAHRSLLNAGKIDFGIGSGIGYAHMWLCAGLPLNSPLLKPKLLLYEEAAIRLQRPTFQISFSSVRQLVLNLQKSPANPTELKGDAFDEESVLGTLEGNSLRTSRRDTSTLRLFLALIFLDKGCMVEMLGMLSNFAKPDVLTSRTYLRFLVIGLAGFEMGRENKDRSLIKLATKCLAYFKTLAKIGSLSATPIYYFIKAVSSPSRSSYDKAISLCREARLIHFEAMACERCGLFLEGKKHIDAANEYITTAFWLYSDWGATSKKSSMVQKYSFLKGSSRGSHTAQS